MPNVLLPAPHFRQSRDGACLPACVRVVLAYWGDLRDEAGLARQLGTKRHGTPVSAVARVALDRRAENLSRPRCARHCPRVDGHVTRLGC